MRISHYRNIPLLFLLLFTLTRANAVKAESPDDILIIANKSIDADTITLIDTKRIFLMQKKTLNGKFVTPINAKKNSPLRKQFAQKVLGKTIAEESSYWENQKVKSGQRPPASLSNTIRAIFSLKNGISYCYRKDFNSATAKILLVL